MDRDNVHDPAKRALVLQEIKEQARTSGRSTQLQYEYELFNLKTQDGGVQKTMAVYPTHALKGGSNG